MQSSAQTKHDDSGAYRSTGRWWMIGGATWLAAGVLDGGLHGWRFDGVETLWIMADLFLLAGLLGLRKLRPHGNSRLGSLGIGLAIVARLIFITAEIVSLLQRTDQNALLPLGAVLTAVGMVAFGIAVARNHIWQGAARFGPLAMGLYPFLVMFPLLAANNGNPPQAAIAGWGLVAIMVGATALSQAHASRPLRSADPSLTKVA